MVARATGMGTSRRLALAGVAVALAVAGCGGGGSSSMSSTRTASTRGASQGAASQGAASQGAAFAWLRPAPAPAGWLVAQVRSGATLFYPPQWRPAHGDPGTATAILLDSRKRFAGYLNVTPRQGNEQLATWASFRPDHNRNEGDRNVTLLASATRLRFRGGSGSCVKDAYTTAVHTHYIELACLVTGARASSVIVGATPPEQWSKVAPVLEQAISSFQT